VTNLDLAVGLRAQAEDRMKVAILMQESDNHAYCVRSCQEAVELALKALLLRGGIEPPKWHDVGRILRDNRGRFPSMSDADVDEACFVSAKLRGDRERSMYGDEETQLPPSDLFSRHDADVSLGWARKVLAMVDREVGGGGGAAGG